MATLIGLSCSLGLAQSKKGPAAEPAPATTASPTSAKAAGGKESIKTASPAQSRAAGSNDAGPKAAAEKGAASSVSAAQASATTPAAESGAGKAEETVDAATYSVRLRDLEQKMNQLKDDIFRSKARLSLLSETVLHGVVSGSQAIITHENQMSNSYRLVKAVYTLDGAPIYSRADEEGLLHDARSLEVYNGSIVPGEHTLAVTLEYRGHGYGVFSYLKGYRFKVSSSYTFTAQEGKGTGINIMAYEKGGPTTRLEERPSVRYVERETSRGDLSAKP